VGRVEGRARLNAVVRHPIGRCRTLFRRDYRTQPGVLTPGYQCRERPALKGQKIVVFETAIRRGLIRLLPLQHLQPATRVQFGLGAVLPHSNTPARNASRSDAGGPSLRVAGFEDGDEDEYEATCESVARA
jgi:hypothetical protein